MRIIVWSKVKEFFKKNWLAFVAFITSIVAVILNRNRGQRLGDSKQLCTDIGERVTDSQTGLDEARNELTNSQSEVESIIDRVDEIKGKAITAGDIVRKYQSRNEQSNETKQ